MNEESNTKQVFENSMWVIVAKIINLFVGLIINIFITRYLGPEQKGIMANSIAISSFWGFLSAFGLLDIMISKFSKEREISGKIAATGMILMLCGGISAYFFSIVSAIFLGVKNDVLIYVLITSFPFLFQCFSIYEYWFYSNSKSKYYSISQLIIHMIFLFLRLLGVLFGCKLLYLIICSSFETIITYLSLIVCYRFSKCMFNGSASFDKEIAHDIFYQSLPMLVMGFATTIYTKVDQIMVGKLMGNIEVGYYSIAVNLAEYWYFIPTAIYSSFLPILAKSFSEQKNFIRRLQQFADIQTLVGYVAIVGVMLCGKWGVVFLYGEEFKQVASILLVYIGTGLFTCLSLTSQAFYIVNKDTRTVMWINIVGAILNFIFNIALITRFGSIGAAYATLLEYALVVFGQMIILWMRYRDLYIVQLKALFPFIRLLVYLKKRKVHN